MSGSYNAFNINNRRVADNNYQLMTDSKEPEEQKHNFYAQPTPPANTNAFPNNIPVALPLHSIIKPSDIDNTKPDYMSEILRQFNSHLKNDKSAFTSSGVRGERLSPADIYLATRNAIPEIAIANPNGDRVALQILFNVTETIKKIGLFDLSTTKHIGINGVHIVNVPRGQYAKIESKGIPKILDQGIHVIHDSGFTINLNSAFIDQNASYIQHKTLHIVRVPAGNIATVYQGQEALLLESQDQPYVYDSPFFKVHPNANGFLKPATEKIIRHGSLTRYIPGINEHAVISKNGALVIGQKAETLKSATDQVVGFVSTAIQNLVLPSEKVQAKRRAENKKATDEEISCEVFTTCDSMRLGVKLFVSYQIRDMSKAISRLNDISEIVNHIENRAAVDMGKAIQQRSSQNFLNTKRIIADAKQEEGINLSANEPSAPPLDDVQHEVFSDLKRDLEEYGIELIRLNFETPQLMDREMAGQLAALSLENAKANAEQAVITQKTLIARSKAYQEAEVSKITADQANANATNAAQAQREAAKLKAETIKILADAEKYKAEMEAEVLRTNPAYLQLQLSKQLASAISGSKMTLLSSDIKSIFTVGGSTLFSMPNTIEHDDKSLNHASQQDSPSPSRIK